MPTTPPTPGGPNVRYDQIGALRGLLAKTEQIAGHLAADADRLAARPDGLRATDATGPVEHLAAAGAVLRGASRTVAEAKRVTDIAWSHISPVGVRLDA